MAADPKVPYQLTQADVRLLRSLRIAPFDVLVVWRDGQRVEIPMPNLPPKPKGDAA